MNANGCLYNRINGPNISSTLTYLYEVVWRMNAFAVTLN